MSRRFGPSALRLSGLAAQMLGWRPHEFWAATPAELAAALAPPQLPGGEPLDRARFNQMMELEHDRCGGQPAD